MPTLRTNTLGFAAKKSIHRSPAKKKHTKAIDLTASSPPAAPAKSLAPLFTKGKRTSASIANPFEDEEEDEDEEAKSEVVEKHENKTVPDGFAPLGKGKPTAEMINNLVGSDEKELVQETVESEGEEEVDPAFFHTEPRSSIVDVDDPAHDLPLKSATSQGVKVRQAMSKALADIEKGSTTKLNPKDKKWAGIYKETQGKMGTTEEPIHCTPQTHNRIHHVLRVFDLSSEWGPCTGISRLERWNRAEAWGLEPPTEIRDILMTQDGAKDASYRETIFHDRGIYVP